MFAIIRLSKLKELTRENDKLKHNNKVLKSNAEMNDNRFREIHTFLLDSERYCDELKRKVKEATSRSC